MTFHFLLSPLRGAIAAATLAVAGSAYASEPAPLPPIGDDAAAATITISPDAPVPDAVCLVAPAVLDAASVEAFLAAPTLLLADHIGGGLPLSNDVRRLAASDSRTLEPLLALVEAASDRQAPAIGSGLARAAFVCGTTQAVYAAVIQAKVAEVANDGFVSAFADTLQDIQTAALPVGASPGYVGAPAISGGGGGKRGGTKGVFRDETTPQTTDSPKIVRRGLFGPGDDDDGGSSNVSPSRVTR